MAASSATKDQPLRFACDRCHFHKLRCSRTDQRTSGCPDTDEPCSRCAKAQVACVQGVRGKVGRPAKSLKRKAAQCEETYPTSSNDGGSEASQEYQQRREEHDQRLVSTQDAQLPSTTNTTTTVILTGMASDVDGEDDSRPTSGPCIGSPSQYQTPDMMMFPLNTSEVGSWETLMLPQDSFESEFVTNFDLPPFPTPTSETCFQTGSVTTPDETDGKEAHVLESSFESTPFSPLQYIDPESGKDCAKSRVSSNDHPLSLSSSGGQLSTPAPSTPTRIRTRTSYEELSDLNLKINGVLGGSEKEAEVGDRILKDASSLASELIHTARQVMSRLVTDTSVLETAKSPLQIPQTASAGRQEMSECGPSPTSEATMPRRAHSISRRTQQQCIADSGLIFLLLACYSGMLNIFELLVDETWTRRDQFAQHGPVDSLLQTSLAVHTVEYLLRLLRQALFPRDANCLEIDPILDENAGWRGASSAAGRGRAPAFGLLGATCAEMRDREQHLLRRTQHLQQLLIR